MSTCRSGGGSRRTWEPQRPEQRMDTAPGRRPSHSHAARQLACLLPPHSYDKLTTNLSRSHHEARECVQERQWQQTHMGATASRAAPGQSAWAQAIVPARGDTDGLEFYITDGPVKPPGTSSQSSPVPVWFLAVPGDLKNGVTC